MAFGQNKVRDPDRKCENGLEPLEVRQLLAFAAQVTDAARQAVPLPLLPGINFAATSYVGLTKTPTAESFWKPSASLPTVGRVLGKSTPAPTGTANVRAESISPFTVSLSAVRSHLRRAPVSQSLAAPAGALSLSLPRPDGTFERFSVWESPIMEDGLARQYTSIKTYAGVSESDPTASLRLSLTPRGMSGQVIGGSSGTYYLDPLLTGNTTTFGAYWRRDAVRHDPLTPCGCGACAAARAEASVSATLSGETVSLNDTSAPRDATASTGTVAAALTPGPGTGTANITYAGQLRTYRLAVAATGEYTASVGGGTVAGALAAIVTAINRVVGIYQAELGISMTLVANNASIIYTNAATDPYSNDVSLTALSENATNLEATIGSANYDIGHLFTTAGGGLADVGSVGRSNKARGVTGTSGSLTGDAFSVDYVAHEMGHQFNASHTFNTPNQASSRSASTAYEPGSGSTIMAYAGISGNDDLQSNSDPYFHSASIDQIRSYVTGTIPTVGTVTTVSNNAPTVLVLTPYVVPASTPLALTAIGNDADGDTVTYDWQQRDLGTTAYNLTAPDSGTGPLFRVYAPTTSPTRTLPRLASILSGANSTAAPSGGGLVERLPTEPRSQFRWRVIVRDGRGGLATTDVTHTVVNTGASFAVTGLDAPVTWAGGTAQTVTWNVAGTTANGINTANVRITLSTDGGQTFPTILATSTANDGSEVITVPFITAGTTTARIRVEAVNNIFFDICNSNFTISPGSTPPAPATPVLTAASDTGVSNSDRITRLNNTTGRLLTFNVGSTVAGDLVRVFSNTTLIGSAIATGTTTAVTTSGTVTLADGVRSIVALRTPAGLVTSSGPSSALSMTVDSVAPTLTFGTISPAVRNTALGSTTLTTSEAVSGMSTGAFSLTRDPGTSNSTAVSLATATLTTVSSTSYSLNNLSTLTATPGNYQLAFPGTGVTDTAGNAITANSTTFSVNVVTLPTTGTNTVRLETTSTSNINIFVNTASNTPTYTWTFTPGSILRIVGGAGNDTVTYSGAAGIPTGGVFNADVDLQLGTGSDLLEVAAGTFTVNRAPSTSVAVDVFSSAKIAFAAASDVRALTLRSGAAAELSATVITNSLSIPAGTTSTYAASVDLRAANLVVRNGNAAALTQLVTTWYNQGSRNGIGIGSSLAGSPTATGRDAIATLGVRANSNGIGGTLLSSLAGFTLATTDVIVRYTYVGDTNLDGQLTSADTTALIKGIRGALTGWANGDTNYDGLINGADLANLTTAQNNQTTPFS